MSRSPALPPSLLRLTRAGWPRGFEVVQFPNPPLILALLGGLSAHLTSGEAHRASRAVFYMGLTVWAYREAVEGDNWFRRLLGAGFLLYIAAQLTRVLHS